MMPAEYDVTGKVVFITGAGRGIGKGIAQVLAEAGADVAINALTPKYVEPLAAEIAARDGPPRRARDRGCHESRSGRACRQFGAEALSGASTCS